MEIMLQILRKTFYPPNINGLQIPSKMILEGKEDILIMIGIFVNSEQNVKTQLYNLLLKDFLSALQST